MVAAPGRFFPDYRPAADCLPTSAALGVTDGDEVLVLVIVTVTNGIADATANLLAPIVIAAEPRHRRAAGAAGRRSAPARTVAQHGRLALRVAGPAHSACWSVAVLILTRRVGESIVVGDDIVLTVFEVRGDAVRIGIEAPRSVRVNRKEVYEEIQRSNEQAVSTSDDALEALRGAIEADPISADTGTGTRR